MNASKVENAKRAAMAKIRRWADVQSKAAAKKLKARAEGKKELDEGSPGKSVKVVLRRKTPTFADDEIVALEKIADA